MSSRTLLTGIDGYAAFLTISLVVTGILGYLSYKFIEQRSISRPPHRETSLA